MPIKFASARNKQPNVQYDYSPMKGGYDELTPPIAGHSGLIRDSLNFEVSQTIAGGYTRIAGYERYDGQPSPSSASFSLIQVTSFTNIPTVGQTLTGFTSSATGVIIAIGANYMAVTKVSGSFTNTEVVKVGGTTIGTATPLTTLLSPETTAQYLNLAADEYRDDILAVPGSGPVRGVVSATFSGVDYVYAFRDNAGGTTLELYKSSGSGWTLVPFYKEVSFTAGGAGTPADGATLTQGGVTATIKRVVLQSGVWASSTAAGRFIITTPSGGNFAAGAATAGAVGVTISGVQTTISMAVGGRFEFDVGNFSGQSTTIRIYGCDGANRGFEFDGDTLVPIVTGATSDIPSHVKIHKNHLCWSFGSSLIHSGPGFPYKYSSIDGAGELACGDTITNFLSQPGSLDTGSLGITTISDTKILYGTSISNWNLVSLNNGIGGVPFSARLLNQAYWLDNMGVINMRAVQDFGNFTQSTLTANIPTFINGQKEKNVYALVNRSKNQYRLLWDDGLGLYLTIVNGKFLGMGKVQFPEAMYCAWNSLNSGMSEEMYCGGKTSGYVYQMDKGSSFDGDDINAYLILNQNMMRSPRIIKRYRRASAEVFGNFYSKFSFGYTLGYNSPHLLQPPDREYDSEFSGVPLWDTFVWDSFTWDGSVLSPSEIELRGSAVNLQPAIRCGTDYIQPFTISSLMYHYTPRRGVR